jgi:hypothetical protein
MARGQRQDMPNLQTLRRRLSSRNLSLNGIGENKLAKQASRMFFRSDRERTRQGSGEISDTGSASSSGPPTPEINATAAAEVHADNGIIDDEGQPVYNPTVVLTREERIKPNFTYSMKIALGFLQVSTTIAATNEIPWPSVRLQASLCHSCLLYLLAHLSI